MQKAVRHNKRPVYKESGNIRPFLQRTEAFLAKMAVTYEIIFALDPSPDDTEAIIPEEINLKESRTAQIGNPKTQENRDEHGAFLQNRILAQIKSQRSINGFQILHGRLPSKLIEGSGNILAQHFFDQISRVLNRIISTIDG